jgi:hypothetical protein
MNNAPQREDHERIRVKSIKKFKPMNNLVLCQIVQKNTESRTKSGIYKASEAYNVDQYLFQNANRVVEVIQPPLNLMYAKTFQSYRNASGDATRPMDWMCDMELRKGDKAWVSAIEAINCLEVVDDSTGEIYQLIHYSDFKVAKRLTRNAQLKDIKKDKFMREDDLLYKVIPLNGYIISEEVKVEGVEQHIENIKEIQKHTKEYEFAASCQPKPKHYHVGQGQHYEKQDKFTDIEIGEDLIDKRYGIARYVGKPVHFYLKYEHNEVIKYYEGDCIKPGDKFFKQNPAIHPMLEDPLHASFNGNKMYFVNQRRNIMFIL